MTHRSLRDSELFEIRIDRLVDKWSGSIEVMFSIRCWEFTLNYSIILKLTDGDYDSQSQYVGIPGDNDKYEKWHHHDVRLWYSDERKRYKKGIWRF